MTSYTRTQVYLKPEDHRRLRRLAAERGHSMTDLVREAVARYVADELREDLPSMDDMVAELHDDPLYAGLPPGREGFAARMRARAFDQPGAGTPLDAADQQLGDALLREHDAHRTGSNPRRTTSDAVDP